jgi:nucleoside-diphosphate-sugar epimerase
MRIFLTGATGYVGTRVLAELTGAGHRVLGLARSPSGAQALLAAGAEPVPGDIEDLDGLHRAAAGCDAVIHTAFDHDFTRYAANCAKDARAIAALGDAVRGSGGLLLITSVTPVGTLEAGQPAIEAAFDAHHPLPRIASELAGQAAAAAGARVAVVRLSQIHDTRRQGLVSELVALARRTGVSAYVGDGANRWSAAHVADTARLYRLALEHGEPGSRFHAVAEEGVPVRAIAEAIARRIGVPVAALPPDRAGAHFGWLAAFAGRDMSARSDATQARLGWRPEGPGLLADIDALEDG